ncbi:hypothetical protein F4781DRAFT_441600 [Annulohypoxylon bovei var. microspora]|nr:hypothetical protein F4781DRAFT_441600 [Annulohypoxylon bovei var. microspora]
MRLSVTTTQAFVAVIMASPVIEPRQGIDTSLVDSAPTPTNASIPIGPTADSTTYDLSKATASATASPLPVGTAPVKRRYVLPRQRACQPLPSGAGPVPTPDTDSSFLGDDDFSTSASQASTPSGYNETYIDLHARSESYGYLGFNAIDSYDPQNCATQCNKTWRGCQGFNIFFERDPSVEPGPNCTNPPSTTTIKCIFWGGLVSVETASNTGQYIADFHVVIAGSNGYMKNAIPLVPGYDGEATGNNTIDAPGSDTGEPSTTTTSSTSSNSTTSTSSTNSATSGSVTSTTSGSITSSSSSAGSTTTTGSTSSTSSTTSSPTTSSTAPPGAGPGTGTYIGSKIFTNTYFDPSLCGAACDSQNQNNLAHPPNSGKPQICRFFTTYLLYKNGQSIGQYCALYTQYYSSSYATNSGTQSGGNTLDVRHAYSYRNTKV